MDNNTYNCIIIDTYTDIFSILVAGRVLTLTHLAAKDSFEDARLDVVIIVTVCVIVCANTGTRTTCGDNTTTKIGCKPLFFQNSHLTFFRRTREAFLAHVTCAQKWLKWTKQSRRPRRLWSWASASN